MALIVSLWALYDAWGERQTTRLDWTHWHGCRILIAEAHVRHEIIRTLVIIALGFTSWLSLTLPAELVLAEHSHVEGLASAVAVRKLVRLGIILLMLWSTVRDRVDRRRLYFLIRTHAP